MTLLSGGMHRAVQVLLQHGADPRLYADDGLTPGQQSSFEHVRGVLDSWDIVLTDGMLRTMQADRDRQRDDDCQLTAAETHRIETQLVAAEKEYATAEKQVGCSITRICCFVFKVFTDRDIVEWGSNAIGLNLIMTICPS